LVSGTDRLLTQSGDDVVLLVVGNTNTCAYIEPLWRAAATVVTFMFLSDQHHTQLAIQWNMQSRLSA